MKLSVRSIHAEELEIFSNSVRSEFWKRFRSARMREWSEATSSPDLCFIAESGCGEILGRLVFSGKGDLYMEFLEIPWANQNYLEIGRELLRRSLIRLKEQGHRSVSHQVGDMVTNSEKRRALMRSAGIPLRREKIVFAAPDSTPPVEQRLRYRAIDDVGRPALVDALVQVNEGCLDMELKERLRAGATPKEKAAFAEEQIDTLSSQFERTEEMWELAYASEDCVGLSMPGLFKKELVEDPNTGTICYIGVHSGKRGAGLGQSILCRATDRLRELGVAKPWADTDSENVSMISTFTRGGWMQTGTNYQYRAVL